MNQEYTCSVCNQKVNHKKSIPYFFYEVNCKYCGNYTIEERLDTYFLNGEHELLILSSWIREQNDLGIEPKLKEDDCSELMEIPSKLLHQKYELCLRYISREQFIEIDNDGLNRLFLVLFWCKDNHELASLLTKGIESNHLKKHGQEYHIKYDGLEFVESLGYQTNSNKIFMAFHFTDEMKEQFETPIKRAVVEASDNKLEAVRVSSSSTDHDTKIDDELISMIKSSKAVIADFTGNRTAVYYEAGYAMGLGIPVIWTCRDTDVDSLSFDTRQYPHIIWKDKDDLYTQVVNRLKAKIL